MRTAMFSGLDMLWKAGLFFALLATLLRLMGKREIRSLSSLDLVVTLMISEAAIITIEDDKIPVLVGVVPVLALAGLQMLTAYLAMKSTRLRGLFSGRPSVLIARGRLRAREIAGLRLNLNDLLGQLRSHGVPSIADVEYAILETDGVLSVIPKAEARPLTARDLGITPPREGLPLDVVVDGEVVASSLKQLRKDEAWVSGTLAAQGLGRPRGVLLASVDAQGGWYVQRKGGAKPVTFSPPPGRSAGGGGSAGQGRDGTRQGGGASSGGAQARAAQAAAEAARAAARSARSAETATATRSASRDAATSKASQAADDSRAGTRPAGAGDPENQRDSRSAGTEGAAQGTAGRRSGPPADRRRGDDPGRDDDHGS